MKVVFLHPDLGIGGAERLIVDAAVALKNKGHDVKVVTNHYDKNHCFKETEDLDITISGSYFPRSIFGSMWALCAYIRMFLAALWIVCSMDFDVIISDQVSFCLPVFRICSPKARRIFYCHHPDLLLTDRKTTAKSVYRFFLDWIEELTTTLADVICVNSNYTAEVTRNTFKSLKDRPLTVLYPSLNTDFFDKAQEGQLPESATWAENVFCSLNRFEVKKNVDLALEAFAELENHLSADDYSKCHLIVAGGYDKRNEENISYYSRLVERSKDLGINDSQITFIKSPSDEDKIALLKHSRAILYTPDKEHFGIVPIEAMYLGTPVIAVKSGGPLETIAHEKTGFLVDQNASEFAKSMARLVNEPELRKIAAGEGPKRVRKLFAFRSFANRLDKIIAGTTVN